MGMNRTKLAAGLLATTAIAIGAVELDANLSARAMLRQALDRHAGLRVGGVFAEPITGRLYLSGITADHDATRVDIGSLILPMPPLGLVSSAMASPFDDAPAEKAPDAPAQAKPDQAPPAASATPVPAAGNGIASADNVVVTSGQTTVRIKHIDMTGTALTSADIAALVDTNSAVPAEARLKKLTATAIIVPEILIDDATPGSERHVAINQVLLSGAVAGKISAGSAASVALTTKQGENTGTGTIGGVQVTSLDTVQIARVFSTVRSDDAEPIRPLYDSVTINSIKFTDETKKSTVSLAILKETGAKARPLATDFIAGGKGHTEKMTEAEKAAVFNDMTSSFEIGTIEAMDFSAKGEKDGVASEFTLTGMALHDFAKGKVGGLGLRALRFANADSSFSVGSVDVGAFALPKPKGSPTGQDAKSLVPALAQIDVRQVDVDVTSDKDNPEGPTHVKFKLAHSGLTSDGDPGEIPKSSKLTLDNLTFDLPPTGQAKALLDMGYSHLDLSSVLATSYNAAGQTLAIDHFILNGVEMGTADIGLNLINVGKGIMSPNQEIAKASALAMLIKALKLDLTNAGLVDRALAWKAKQDGISVDDERKFVIDFLSQKLPASMNGNANVKIIGDAAAKFVATPKTLHIAITSKSGLGAGSMALLSDPGLLLDTLDVKASAND